MRLEKKRLYENFKQLEEGKKKNRKGTAFHRLKRKQQQKKHEQAITSQRVHSPSEEKKKRTH